MLLPKPSLGIAPSALTGLLAGSWRREPPPVPMPEGLATLVPLLLRGGVAGLAWRVLRGGGRSDAPPLSALQDAHRYQALETRVQQRAIASAVSVLRAEGVEPLLGKGRALSRLYPEPGLRPAGDVDLYVPPPQVDLARSALAAQGLGGIDLHAGAAELADRRWEELVDRSVCLEIGATAVRVFGAEDHARLIALHLLRHGAWRPLWLCDLAVSVELQPVSFDWDRLLAGDPRRADGVGCALALARDLLGACLDGAPRRVRARVLPRWVVPSVLRLWHDAERVPQSQRRPWTAAPKRPLAALRALLDRWPGPVEATANLRAPFNGLPRLPFQVAECVRRTSRFAWAHRR